MQNQDVIKFYENKTRVQLRNVADKFLIFFVYTESNEQRLVLSYNFNQSYVYKKRHSVIEIITVTIIIHAYSIL